MTIFLTSLQERLRKKEFYIVLIIAVFILLLCSSDSSTITIAGEPVTSFSNMFVVMHTVINAAACLLALILSLQTIPTEYKEKRSHLIWSRGISQVHYHSQLVLANAASTGIATVLLYLALAVYTLAKGETQHLPAMVFGCAIVWINVLCISLLTSVLSIKLPTFATALISSVCIIVGLFHGILDLYKNIIGGASGAFVTFILNVFPDFNGIQTQAINVVMGDVVHAHVLWKGLLTAYIISFGLSIFRKKEA